jgi:cobyrinic acid a,c-diamide synthase
VAPLLLGYQQFDPQVNIAGVILNFVGGGRHAAKLTAVIERYTNIPILGTIHRNQELELVERYLGLMPTNEDAYADAKVSRIAKIISSQVDLKKIISLSHSAEKTATLIPDSVTRKYDLTIAYAQDEAFGFYYADDLDTFREFGVSLIPFNTLHDSSLPVADALFIGGGFPEKRMHELSKNTKMKQAVRDAIKNGMPAYAECGGLMYLCNSIKFDGEQCEMVGIIDADCEMHTKPIGRGYTLLQKNQQHPWSKIKHTELPGHEFHYSKLFNVPANTQFAYQVNRGYGVNGKFDGILYKNLLACYAHQRNTQQNQWISSFLDFVKTIK